MKYVPDKTGRFSQRPHYKVEELDRECENIIVTFLRDKHGKVKFPVSTDDLTLLIEQVADDLDLYADLSHFGLDVEGVTEFFSGRKPNVKISAHLSNDSRRENRLRTTLTHEYGHVHFHAYLWEIESSQQDLLKSTPHANKQICKRDNILNANQYDWMEWQAGYISGSLLMPITHIKQLLHDYQKQHNIFYPVSHDSVHGLRIIEATKTSFQVSEEAARVRLSKLRFLDKEQPSLGLFSN